MAKICLKGYVLYNIHVIFDWQFIVSISYKALGILVIIIISFVNLLGIIMNNSRYYLTYINGFGF